LKGMFEREKMMKKSMIGAAIGIAVYLFSVNAMAAAVIGTYFPASSGPIGEPAMLLFNGAVLLGLGVFLRNRSNRSA